MLQRLRSLGVRGALRLAGGRDARRPLRLCHALLSERGEAWLARVAADALAQYTSLHGVALDAFFDGLAEQFEPDSERVRRMAETLCQDPSRANLVRLQAVVESPRQELFRRLNVVPSQRRLRRLLFDYQLSERPAGHVVWKFPDQTGHGRSPAPVSALGHIRDALASPWFRPVAHHVDAR
jgi:hypothetical protein